MTLKELGYNESLEKFKIERNWGLFEIGRIIAQHKDRYTIKSPVNEFDAELIGNLRFTAVNRYDLPAVGDWVAFSAYDESKALIHAIYPRTSILERKAVGKSGQVQIIATNIDYGLIVQSVNRDFNLNRLERYLTICNAAGVTPVIILSKTDLIANEELTAIVILITDRIKDIPIIKTSNQTNNGYEPVKSIIKPGKTYCLLGSSGVGKSTLINALSGQVHMKTAEISTSVNKGRHITSHRELIILENGSMLIDNPGMREIGIADTSSGLEITFDSIMGYAENCKFKNCTHVNEIGCAILDAVQNGEIDTEAYANFRKMEKEKIHFESSIKEKRKKEKSFSKLIRKVQNQKDRNKYK